MNNNMDKKTIGFELITPQIAQEYLKHNTNNRPVNKNIVSLYAKQMRKGLWEDSNDAICFSKEGELLNGQHRLFAICESGVACEFIVRRGLERKSINVMDNQHGRTAADLLQMMGIEGSKHVASIIKRKMNLESRMTVLRNQISGCGGACGIKVGNVEVIEEYNKHIEDYEHFSLFSQSLYRKNRILTTSDYGGIIAYLIMSLHHPKETVYSFWEEFVEKKSATNDVVILLRQKLTNDKLSSQKMTTMAKQKLIIKAWNAYITGKTVKVLKYVESVDKDLWFV